MGYSVWNGKYDYFTTYVSAVQPGGLIGSTRKSKTGSTTLEKEDLLSGFGESVSGNQTTRTGAYDDIVVCNNLEIVIFRRSAIGS